MTDFQRKNADRKHAREMWSVEARRAGLEDRRKRRPVAGAFGRASGKEYADCARGTTVRVKDDLREDLQ